MALSAVDLCSRALLKIGAHGIASFDEGSVEAEVAASLYPAILDGLLSAHPWNFATTQARLALLADAPESEFASAFALPADCLRILTVGIGHRDVVVTYRIRGRRVLTDAPSVLLTYIARPHEDEFPPFFCLALIARLAAEFCIPLTESTSRWEGMQKLADLEFRRAKLIDAQEDTPASLTDFTLIEGRF